MAAVNLGRLPQAGCTFAAPTCPFVAGVISMMPRTDRLRVPTLDRTLGRACAITPTHELFDLGVGRAPVSQWWS